MKGYRRTMVELRRFELRFSRCKRDTLPLSYSPMENNLIGSKYLCYMHITLNCLFCNNPNQVRVADANRGHGKYCNKTCFHKDRSQKMKARVREPNASCAFCNKKFYRSASKLKRKHNLVFCNKICKDTAQSIMGGCTAIQPQRFGTGNNYRAIAFRFKLELCERCGFSDTKAIVVHHRDRNHENNVYENLEVLCCNCHAIEHHKS